jgi:DNA-binding NarL/FixJ family response regulator
MNSETLHPRIRVLVVDDHDLICEGLTVLLERQDGVSVVGYANSGAEAVSRATQLMPDIIVMDLMLPDINGIDATLQIMAQLPLTRIVALSASDRPENVYRALRAGARGYLLKNAIRGELVAAIQAVYADRYYLSPGIDQSILADALRKSPEKTPIERLSLRERDVLQWIVGGATSAEIGVHMALSRKTIDTYRSRLMVKLGVANRSALIRFAMEHVSMPPVAASYAK